MIAIAGVPEEIGRLEVVIEQCRERNPHNLDIPFRRRQLAVLRVLQATESEKSRVGFKDIWVATGWLFRLLIGRR